MKKIISVLAAAGVIAALSIPAFASEGRPPAMRQACWKPLSLLLAKVSIPTLPPQTKPLTTRILSIGASPLWKIGGEYVAELGEGLSTTDTTKDPCSNSILPESPCGWPDGEMDPGSGLMAFRPPFPRLRQNAAEENSKGRPGDCVPGPDARGRRQGNKIPPTSFSAFRCGYKTIGLH